MKLFMRILTILMFMHYSCVHKDNPKSNCEFTLIKFKKTINIKDYSKFKEDSLIYFDERNGEKIGGIFTFSKSGKYLNYMFCDRENSFTYSEEYGLDGFYKTGNPIVRYEFNDDKEGNMIFNAYYFNLNKRIFDVILSLDNVETHLKIRDSKQFQFLSESSTLVGSIKKNDLKKHTMILKAKIQYCDDNFETIIDTISKY